MSVKGGQALKNYLERMIGRASNAKEVEVGFMENATYPDGTSVALVAMVNEYGRPENGQPPRPFMRRAVNKRSAAWQKNFGTALKQTNYDARRSFAMIGTQMKEDIQKSIRDLKSPPIKKATAEAKGFDKPLIDTGHMLNSVDYRVK